MSDKVPMISPKQFPSHEGNISPPIQNIASDGGKREKLNRIREKWQQLDGSATGQPKEFQKKSPEDGLTSRTHTVAFTQLEQQGKKRPGSQYFETKKSPEKTLSRVSSSPHMDRDVKRSFSQNETVHPVNSNSPVNQDIKRPFSQNETSVNGNLSIDIDTEGPELKRFSHQDKTSSVLTSTSFHKGCLLEVMQIFDPLQQKYDPEAAAQKLGSLVARKEASPKELVEGVMRYYEAVVAPAAEESSKELRQLSTRFQQAVVSMSIYDKTIPLLCALLDRLKYEQRFSYEKCLDEIYQLHLKKEMIIKTLPLFVDADLQKEQAKNLFRSGCVSVEVCNRYAAHLLDKEIKKLIKFLRTLKDGQELLPQQFNLMAGNFLDQIYQMHIPEAFKDLAICRKTIIEQHFGSEKIEAVKNSIIDLICLRGINSFLITEATREGGRLVHVQQPVIQLCKLFQHLANGTRFDEGPEGYKNLIIEAYQKRHDQFMAALLRK